jgi:hypothetical protein
MGIRGFREIFDEYVYPVFFSDWKSEREAIEQFKEKYLNVKSLHKEIKLHKDWKEVIRNAIHEIMIELQRSSIRLKELEEEISRKNYEGMEEYPTEIKELMEKGNEIYALKRYQRVGVELLTKIVKTLQKYLERGGKLKKEDARNYVSWIVECMGENPGILMELDLSLLLLSLGYTRDEVNELNNLINQYIVERIRMEIKKEPTRELKNYLRNEFLLINLVWV